METSATVSLNQESVLLAIATDARTRAHAQYSNFKVGAALETADGRIIGGCNIENATYGLTLCAERVALVSMGTVCQPFSLRRSPPPRRWTIRRSGTARGSGEGRTAVRRSLPLRRSRARGTGWPRRGAAGRFRGSESLNDGLQQR
jgi:hypothetical protein